MSEVNNVVQTSNVLITNYDVSKFLLGDNYFIEIDIAASGSDIELKQGMVVGKISATGKGLPLDKDATDGSEYPIGCAIIDETIAGGETKTVTLVNKGRIDKDTINFADVETLATVVNERQLGDQLNDLGLIIQSGQELTDYDNS